MSDMRDMKHVGAHPKAKPQVSGIKTFKGTVKPEREARTGIKTLSFGQISWH